MKGVLAMSIKNTRLALIPCALSLLLAIGTMTIFHACEMKDDGTWMHCHTAQVYVAACAAGLSVLLLPSVFLKSRAVRILAGVIGFAGGIVVLFIPGNIVSMCMMNTMRCYTVMQPFVRIMAVLITVSSGISLIQSWKVV